MVSKSYGARMRLYNNRIKKTVNGESSYYINDGLRVLNELDGLGNVNKSIVAGLEQVAEIDENGIIQYIHTDVLGSTVLITDDQGEVTAEYEYDVFGSVVGKSGLAESNYLFTNQEFDSESELYYYNARYYNPTTGRFISRDPFLGRDGDVLSRNSYVYVKNNPLKYVDPTGEEEKDVFFTQERIAKWNKNLDKMESGLNFVGDMLTFGQFSKAFENAGNAGKKMGAEGVNVGTVSNVVVQVTFGTVRAGGGALATGILAGKGKMGSEIKIGKNIRIAPFGNRPKVDPTWAKRLPHYHRRILDKSGDVIKGGSIKRHRPWDAVAKGLSWFKKF